MRKIYTALFYLLMPAIWLRLLWRARRNPDYAKRWRERLGFVPQPIAPGSVWWHAVSVGETLAAVPVINAFHQQFPHIPLLVTTMTPTGSQQVIKQLGDKVQHVYIPYDLPTSLQRFLAATQPHLLVIMETELWPNLLHACKTKNIPVLLANARLSQKSADGYARFAALTKEMLNNVTHIAAQHTADAERFVQLGMPQARISITGTVKFDITLPENLLNEAKQLRKQWNVSRPVWIAASTHAGEEEIILAALQKIIVQQPDILLVLVPRHPDRVKEVQALCQKYGFTVCTRSSGESVNQNTQIFLLDTLGELLLFYATADIAFVGGSLINKGGHNVLEPAALGLPIITGKSMFNFAEIERLLLQAQALIHAGSADEISTQVLALLNDSTRRKKSGDAARAVIEANRGAVAKHIALIEQMLK